MPSRALPITPRLVPVLAVALLGLTAAAVTPCAACSCASAGSLADSAARADVVFVGTFVGTRGPDSAVPGLTSSADEVGRVFEVTEVRKGAAAARTEVRTAASGGSCGLEVEQGSVYVVVASSTGAGLTGGLCDGTRLLSATASSDLDAVGPPQGPRPGATGADVPEPASVSRDALPLPLGLGAAITGAAGLLALAGALVARGRRRGSEPPGDPLR